MKLALYFGASLGMATTVCMLAMAERPNFYSACVALATNSISLCVLINLALAGTFALGKLVQFIFFGPLRILESEHLLERGWFGITETFLAMTMYREEFTVGFVSKFVLLTFMRVFHWLCSDRVELIFQNVHGPPSRFALARIGSAIVLFMTIDICLSYCTTKSVIASGPSNEVVFGFEYLLLLNSIMLCAGILFLNTKESDYLEEHEDEDKWEPKATYMFYLHLSMDLIRLLVICAFFIALLKPYGIPLHLLRDLYITVASLTRRIHSHRAFLKTRSLMDEHIPNAVEADLVRDDMCIICREEMAVLTPSSPLQRKTPKRLHCGHVIHYGCLKSWFERSQRCPTCRQPVLENAIRSANHAGQAAATNVAPPAPGAVPTVPENTGAPQPTDPTIHPSTTSSRSTSTAVPTATQVTSGDSHSTPSIATNTISPTPTTVGAASASNSPLSGLPAGWNAVPTRVGPTGEMQIEFSPGVWATVKGSSEGDQHQEMAQRVQRMEQMLDSIMRQYHPEGSSS